MERTILHCDMNSFYASVELLEYKELRGKPMAVCGNVESRHGIILAKSEEAKRMGVVTAETVWQAKRKCPNLVLVPPHHEKYSYYSKKINEIYERYTDMIEPFSIDESWLDVTGSLKLFGDGRKIADEIRQTVKTELGLTLSVGVSYNKVFAKMGSEYKKPDATTEINKENYKKLIWPLPVNELFFVGNATAEKLKKSGIKTIGDLAVSNKKYIENMLGKQGTLIHDYANGIDESPVSLYCEKQKIKSVGNGVTFKRNILGNEDITTAIIALSDTVAGRLRKYDLKCSGVKLDIKDPLFRTISRQKKLEIPSCLSEEIAKASLELIKSSWKINEPIRMLTITGIGLSEREEDLQLSFFSGDEKDREKSIKIEKTLDKIRNKYGGKSITFACIINNDIGIEFDVKEELEVL